MVDHRLTDEEKNLLKSLIGSRLVNFTAEKIWENKFTPSYWIDLKFEETLDYEKAIYPVAEVIEDWALTEDACDDPFYTTTATCERKFISLKDGGEIVR